MADDDFDPFESPPIPDYLVAADNHNVASNSWTFKDVLVGGSGTVAGAAVGSVIPGVGTLIGAGIGGALGGSLALNQGKWFASSIVSGAASFYNTGVEVSNWFGSDAQKVDVGAKLTEYDSDLGAYYANNQNSVDLAGFLAGSLIPTVGAMKLYNYAGGALGIAKAGAVGTNFTSATGLLGNIQAKTLQTAITEMSITDAGFSAINSQMLKAFAVGTVDEAIGGAFATAVTLSTMHASPVLNQMDAGDLAHNVLEGAVFGGALGGLIRGAGIYGEASRGVSGIKGKLVTPYTYSESLPEGSQASHRIVNSVNSILSKPEVEIGLEERQFNYANRKRNESIRRAEDDIRTDFAELTKKDYGLSVPLSDTVAQWKDVNEAEKHLIGVTEISRVSAKTDGERAITQAQKAEKSAILGDFTQAHADTLANTQVTYLKIHGEGKGAVTSEAPSPELLNFADRMKPGSQVVVTGSGVTAEGLGNWKFSTDPNKKFNYLVATNDEAQARNIWASSKKGPALADGSEVHYDDVALLKRAYELGVSPKIIAKDGVRLDVASKDELIGYITDAVNVWKERTLESNALLKPNDKTFVTNTNLSRRLDVTLSYLEGEAVNVQSPTKNLFALKTSAEDYTQGLIDAGRISANSPIADIANIPSYAKLISDTTPFRDLNNNVLSGMALIKEKARLQQTALDNAFNKVVGKVGVDAFGNSAIEGAAKEFPDFPAAAMSRAPAEGGPGQGFFTTANKGYGSLGSVVQQIGAGTHRLIKRFISDTEATLTPAAYGVQMDLKAALEWQALQQKLRATGETYYHDYENSNLYLRRLKNKDINIIDAKADDVIQINSPAVNELWKAHIERNGTRVDGKRVLQSASGYKSTLDSLAAYPIPVNQKHYPHFALVVDETITGSGRVSQLYAASAGELDKLITQVENMPQKLKVYRKDEIERNKEALGIFNQDDVISENAINIALQRRGVSSNFIPKTDPQQIIKDLTDWHMQQDRQLARYAVSAKYSKEFDELNRLAEASTGLQTSRVGFASLSSYMEGKVKNPITDYIKMALDMPSTNEVPYWTAFNNIVDNKFTQVTKAVSNIWRDEKNLEAAAPKINAVFDSVGLKHPIYDAYLQTLANHTPDSGALTSFVSKVNSILTSLVLRADPINALNNGWGSLVLTATEMNQLLKAIQKNDSSLKGAGELGYIKLPGTEDTILSPAAMWARSAGRFWTDPKAVEWAKEHGFTTRNLLDAHAIVDDLSINPALHMGQLDSKVNAAYSKFMGWADKAERVTGNKFAEEFNRFVSADIMKTLTDVAISQGIMDSKTALAYINTFVNRTQGVYIASQRPLMFQGAVGQAIGLFQSYQFNMMQQLMRYIADGTSKSAAMALGMQGTIYGLHGLPAFDAINTHLIGTASGNPNNRDAYDAAYGIAGKTAGDWLMYGLPSNLLTLVNSNLGMNLYTRGDINPRQLTVVPVNPANVPIIAGTMKFFGAAKDSFTRMANGGDVYSSFLQGVEHAGVNRPLTGLAQTLEALGNPQMQSFGTTAKGDVTSANDLMSLANFVRLAGAKPLDEAIALDAAYRLDAYKAKDIAVRNNIGEALKTKVIGGKELTPDDIHDFQAAYMAAGGKQQEFNQFMMHAMKSSNTSHANKIADNLKSPHSQSMQTVMGPYDLRDFSSRY